MKKWILATLTLLLPGLGGLGRTAAPAAKPNIVIVMADDMGWRDTGYRGNPIVKTPHLDDMASKGIQFEYFYPGQQMCTPGRFALMSGRNPCRTGLHHLGATRPEEIFLPRAIKQAGYKSAHFGKWHLGAGKSSPVGMGFDQAHWTPNYHDLDAKFQIDDTKTFVETKGDSSVAVMELALDYVRKQAKAGTVLYPGLLRIAARAAQGGRGVQGPLQGPAEGQGQRRLLGRGLRPGRGGRQPPRRAAQAGHRRQHDRLVRER